MELEESIMKKWVKKSWLVAMGLVMVLSVGLAGCGNKDNDNSLQKIKDKGTLVVGTSADYAPFEFPIVKNGKKQITGYDILIAKQIAKDMGVKLKIQNTEFSSLISDLKGNKVDLVLSGMTDTKSKLPSQRATTPLTTTCWSGKQTPTSTTRRLTRRVLKLAPNKLQPRKTLLRPKRVVTWSLKAS